MDDMALLRKFEPVVCYTYGEMFFPAAVDEYLRLCSLWMRDSNGQAQQLAAAGDLSVEKLAEFKEVPAGHTLYLQLVEKPLEAFEYQQWLRRADRPSFQAPGRLARVGLISRVLGSLFNLTLLLRGTVPGGTEAAAEIKYREMRRQDPRYVYYGRVIREGGYVILHYLFFFAMNDWRSGFYGVNDHEADWEQIFVYLSEEEEGDLQPRWTAYASHDFSGDDLRRRWDDPELRRYDETHPLIFAGAGSHASYFEQGEYKMSVEPGFLRPVKNALILLRKFWVEKLGQGDAGQVSEEVGALLSVPFIDYARGDGVRIGPGQEHSWTPIILDESLGWVENYRGLWGLDTRDPLGGERAPAGPKYNRDGSVRTAWYDPLGWAGLDKVPPPGLAPAKQKERIQMLSRDREALKVTLAQKREEVRLLALEVQSLKETDYLNHLYNVQEEKLDKDQQALQALYNHYTELTETWKASQSYLEKIERGDWGDPQAHLRHKHPPEPPLGSQARITELWAAISGGLLLLTFTILLILEPGRWLTWTILVGIIFVAIESIVRGRFGKFLLNVTVVLAVITAVLLVIDFWWLILIVAMFILVIAMIVGNLRELWVGSSKKTS